MPEKAWTLNAREGLDPNNIRCRSMNICHWICHQCPKGQPHRWQARPDTLHRGHRCPCCSGRKACTCNSLQSLFPEVAAEWDYTRNLSTPADYATYSNSKVWWNTNKRGSFEASINSRTCVRKSPPRRPAALKCKSSYDNEASFSTCV